MLAQYRRFARRRSAAATGVGRVAAAGRRVAAGPPLAEVRVLAATATAKMRHIRSAVHWILASLTLLATTAVLTAAS